MSKAVQRANQVAEAEAIGGEGARVKRLLVIDWSTDSLIDC